MLRPPTAGLALSGKRPVLCPHWGGSLLPTEIGFDLMAHSILSLVTLVGISCQLRLAWPAKVSRAEPDYAIAIEGLAAVALHIDELIEAKSYASPARLGELRRAKQFVEVAAQLLLDDLRQGQR